MAAPRRRCRRALPLEAVTGCSADGRMLFLLVERGPLAVRSELIAVLHRPIDPAEWCALVLDVLADDPGRSPLAATSIAAARAVERYGGHRVAPGCAGLGFGVTPLAVLAEVL